jgi:Fur family ferric uptake transcriptional regulator
MTDDVRPLRHTRHRKEVGTLLRETTEFLSAQGVHALLRERGSKIGLTTVYRALQTLSREGVVDAVRTSTGEQVYRSCSRNHHHHLMCRFCARVIEVEGPAIEQWVTAVAGEHGFRDINHSVEIFGTCLSCGDGQP